MPNENKRYLSLGLILLIRHWSLVIGHWLLLPALLLCVGGFIPNSLAEKKKSSKEKAKGTPAQTVLADPATVPETTGDAPTAPVNKQTDSPGARQRSSSTSKQFIIDGGDHNLRGAVGFYLEDVRNNLEQLLQTQDTWEYPIVINIRPEDVFVEKAVTASVSQIDTGGYRFLLTARIGEDFNAKELAREELRLLLAERILRGHKNDAIATERILPPWIHIGIMEAIDFKSRGGPDETFVAVFQRGAIPHIEEILKDDPTNQDLLTRELFRVSSGGLVLTLLGQPDGPARFKRYLNDLAVAPDQGLPLIQKHFPGMRGASNSLSKWWALQLAYMSTRPDIFAVMSPKETAERLSEILKLRMVVGPDGKQPSKIVGGGNVFTRMFRPGGGNKDQEAKGQPVDKDKAPRLITVPLEQFARLRGRDDVTGIINAIDSNLNEIFIKGFPSYHPVAKEYRSILHQLRKGDEKGVPAHLEALSKELARINEWMKQIEYAMDWYQANTDANDTGNMDKYIEIRKEMDKPLFKRTDPITLYMDKIEKEYEEGTLMLDEK